MIIAILEDKKKFRNALTLIEPLPYIKIPVPPSLMYSPLSIYQPTTVPNCPVVEFYFDLWLEENKIALYKERN